MVIGKNITYYDTSSEYVFNSNNNHSNNSNSDLINGLLSFFSFFKNFIYQTSIIDRVETSQTLYTLYRLISMVFPHVAAFVASVQCGIIDIYEYVQSIDIRMINTTIIASQLPKFVAALLVSSFFNVVGAVFSQTLVCHHI